MALGFDTFLVIRHGLGRLKSDISDVKQQPLATTSGEQLGCYFCSDVVAPGNVIKRKSPNIHLK